LKTICRGRGPSRGRWCRKQASITSEQGEKTKKVKIQEGRLHGIKAGGSNFHNADPTFNEIGFLGSGIGDITNGEV